MTEYVIPLEQIKQAVAVSLRPDRAWCLACGIDKLILVTNLDPAEFALVGLYCLIHSAQVKDEDLTRSLDGFKAIQISPDFAPPG